MSGCIYTDPETRSALSDEVRSMEETYADPIARTQITNLAGFVKLMKNKRAQLERTTPPDVSGPERNMLQRRVDELAAAFTLGNRNAVCPMPSQMNQEKCPTGAEGFHLEHQNFWQTHNIRPNGDIYHVEKDAHGRMKGQALVHELKDGLRVLGKEREGYDPDIANLEKFRPIDQSPSLADTRIGVSYAPNARLSYYQYVTQHPEYVPPKLAVQAGLYPGFALVGGVITRTPEHPAFERLGSSTDAIEDAAPFAPAKMPDSQRCTSQVARGGPCKRRREPGSELCHIHAQQAHRRVLAQADAQRAQA